SGASGRRSCRPTSSRHAPAPRSHALRFYRWPMRHCGARTRQACPTIAHSTRVAAVIPLDCTSKARGMELAPGYAGGDVADVAGVGCKMETDRMTTRAMTAPMAAASDNTALIAECAYYKAERRGFEPG